MRLSGGFAGPMTLRALLPLFFLSGMCALVYELVWTRWLGLIMGNFLTATSVVLAIFMTGLAIGSYSFGRLAARFSPAGGVGLYALLEAGLAVLAALSPLLLSTTSGIYPELARAMPLLSVRAGLSAIVLLAPTILMGGTLPALVRALSAARPDLLGPVYAVNTAGAAIGPLLGAFVLMPALGMVRTLLFMAAVNASLAAAAYWISRRWPEKAAAPEQAAAGAEEKGGPAWSAAYGLAFVSGMLALALEVGLTRQVQLLITGGSVYGLAIVLAAFLVGMSLGAAGARRFPPADFRGAMLAYAAALCGIYIFSLSTPFWDLIPPAMAGVWSSAEGFTYRMSLNFGLVFLLLLFPAACFGYALPSLAAALPSPGPASVGRLFAANTVGATLGALSAGFWLLPGLGLSRALLAIGGVAAAASGAAFFSGGVFGKRWLPAVILPPALGLLFLLPRPDGAVMNSGAYNRPGMFLPGMQRVGATPRELMHWQGKIIYEEDGYFGHIAVRAAGPKYLTFVVNGKPDGSTTPGDLLTQVLSAHLGLWLHPDPRRVLLVGLGTGVSAGSVSLHRGIQELHVAEIEPVQLKVAEIFSQHNYNVLEFPKLVMHLDDARHVLLTREERYDVILTEPSNLFVSGMVNLYTREFFELARQRLSPGGVLLVFVHYYQASAADLKGVYRTFSDVFPSACCWLHGGGDCFLVGIKGGLAIDLADWERRWKEKWVGADLRRVDVNSPLDIAKYYLWGPEELGAYAGEAKICTDDYPYLEFTSARVPWGNDISAANRASMLNFEVKDPLPLKGETAGLRVKLGEAFLSRGRLARARIEFSRALALDPGVPGAASGLERLADYREDAAER